MKNLGFIDDSDVLEGYSEDGGGTPMRPDYLVRPQTTEEVQEILKYCSSESISLTPSGRRTCDTGSGLTDSGVLLSTERMQNIIQINEEEGYVDVQPGVLLFDLKEALREKGLFYPPDPSSEKIASIGGTVATNAAGARSFKYGHTSRHILGMEVVLADGRLERVYNYTGRKCTTGPASLHEMGRLFVGSEGIFGVFASIRLKVYKGVPDAYAMCAFFKSAKDMHQFNREIVKGSFAGVSPRSMEFMDETCLSFIRDSGKFPQVPAKGQVCVMFEQEFLPGEQEKSLEAWLEVLETSGALLDDTIVADTYAKIMELRELRHYPPSLTWEMGKEQAEKGGKKISTDWATPVINLEKMMIEATSLCTEYGFPPERVFRYAHLGDGHPHYNFVSRDHEETEKALLLRRELSKLALKYGGTIAGEHGIGKFRRELYQLEGAGLKNQLLRAVKEELDPEGILAPGNLL